MKMARQVAQAQKDGVPLSELPMPAMQHDDAVDGESFPSPNIAHRQAQLHTSTRSQFTEVCNGVRVRVHVCICLLQTVFRALTVDANSTPRLLSAIFRGVKSWAQSH